MFTKYFFNGLIYNPAVAGSSEHLSANLIYRSGPLMVTAAYSNIRHAAIPANAATLTLSCRKNQPKKTATIGLM